MQFNEPDGEFWADAIKRLKDKPAERLEMAKRYFPLPGAFREALIACRALIRAKKKAKEAFTQELATLYHVAALESFGLGYSTKCELPGFTLLEQIDFKEIEKLAYTYAEIGYKHLKGLKETDVKWLVDAWGEPLSHSTLNWKYSEKWQALEDDWLKREQKRKKRLQDDFASLSKSEQQMVLDMFNFKIEADPTLNQTPTQPISSLQNIQQSSGPQSEPEPTRQHQSQPSTHTSQPPAEDSTQTSTKPSKPSEPLFWLSVIAIVVVLIAWFS